MISFFSSGRFYKVNNSWYVSMRPGDEQHQSYCGLSLVKIEIVDGQTTAGPFRRRKSARRWLDGFISFYGKLRGDEVSYISDAVIIPDFRFG